MSRTERVIWSSRDAARAYQTYNNSKSTTPDDINSTRIFVEELRPEHRLSQMKREGKRTIRVALSVPLQGETILSDNGANHRREQSEKAEETLHTFLRQNSATGRDDSYIILTYNVYVNTEFSYLLGQMEFIVYVNENDEVVY